jgi:hypothetical protein
VIKSPRTRRRRSRSSESNWRLETRSKMTQKILVDTGRHWSTLIDTDQNWSTLIDTDRIRGWKREKWPVLTVPLDTCRWQRKTFIVTFPSERYLVFVCLDGVKRCKFSLKCWLQFSMDFFRLSPLKENLLVWFLALVQDNSSTK